MGNKASKASSLENTKAAHNGWNSSLVTGKLPETKVLTPQMKTRMSYKNYDLAGEAIFQKDYDGLWLTQKSKDLYD